MYWCSMFSRSPRSGRTYSWLLLHKDQVYEPSMVSILIPVFSTMWIYLVTLSSTRADSSSHFNPGLCCLSRLIFLLFLVLIFLSNSSRLANHVENEQTNQWLVCHLYPISSTGMNNSEYSIHHLASSCISSVMEIAPPSPCKISASVSLLDSIGQNMRVSIVPESMVSSKGQFASSKLSINRDT